MTIANRKRIPLYTLFITKLISVTGDAMAAIAIPWFVLETTGSALQTGIVAFFSITPIIIGTSFGGPWVDRLGYKRVSVVADLASGVTILLIPVLHATVGLEFWQLLALVFLGNLMDAPGQSARSAILPELADEADISVERAVGLSESLQRATTMLGAPIAGVMIAIFGATGVLTVNAVTFGLSALGMMLFVPAHLAEQNIDEADNTYWQNLKTGYDFVKKDYVVLSVLFTVMVTNMVDFSMTAVTYPVYMQRLFGTVEGATLFGILIGVFGASALASSLLFSWLGERVPNQPILFAGVFFLLSFRFLIFAVFPPFWSLLLVSALSGALAGPINPILMTILYRRVPEHMRGRVFGIGTAGVLVAMPLGGVMGGFFLEWFDLQITLVIYAVVYVLATTTLFFNPHIQTLDTSANINN